MPIMRITMQPEPFELPAVRIAPLPDLASAARSCARLAEVRRLAEWVGTRRITKSGNLTLADARKAVQQLRLPGDQGPGRTPARKAADFPELHHLWVLAVEAELVYAGGGTTQPGPALDLLHRDRDEDLVAVWTKLFAAEFELILSMSALGDDLVPLMMRLYVDMEPVSVGELLLEVLLGMGDGDHDLDDVMADPVAMAVAGSFAPDVAMLLGGLSEMDAVTIDDDQVAATELGRHGLTQWFEGWGVSTRAVTDLADASAADLFDLSLGLESPEEFGALFAEWVSARSAAEAAAALVDYARGGTPTHRVMAFALLNQLGGPAEAAVRSVIDDKDLAPHAKAWLATTGIDVVEPTLDDVQRLFIDMVASSLDDEVELKESIGGLAGLTDADQVELIGSLWECDHADTVAVLEAVAAQHPDPAAVKAAKKALMRARTNLAAGADIPMPSPTSKAGSKTYRLKITLMHTEPPIWRRIQVPGSVNLSELHTMIQTAMGWEDCHLHEFEIRGVRYGEPGHHGGPVVSESTVQLADVARKRSRLAYTYDFGDDWRHEVLVEDVVPASEPTPVCLDGQLACPPEDVGGAWGYAGFLEAYADPTHQDYEHFHEWAGENFDPAAFDVEEVNRQLQAQHRS